MAAAKIECGLIKTAVAGGFESCSTKPVRVRNPHHPDYVGDESNDIRELFKFGNAYHLPCSAAPRMLQLYGKWISNG